MSNSAKVAAKEEIVERYGPWTAHNISLGDGLFTITADISGDEVKLRRVLQIVSDTCGGGLNELRVLDLACLEGMYGIELAARGARVTAIEGREANLAKARFAAKALEVENIEFHLDDVRNLSQEKYGRFDVVLCLGILYHLDETDVFDFLEKIYEVCRNIVVIDTHVSFEPEVSFRHRGKEYQASIYREHRPDADEEEMMAASWASLDNMTSLFFSRSSLFNLLYDVGFSSVYECFVPAEVHKPEDRITLLAMKGRRTKPVTCPQLPDGYQSEAPEPVAVTANTTAGFPRRVKGYVKALLGARS